VLARISALTALLAFAGLQQQPPDRPPWSVPQVSQPVAVAGSDVRKLQLSPRNANYTIKAALDPAARTITGEETISWRNIATVAAPTLQFHLYYNAWRDNRSSWMRELALTGSDLPEIPPEHRGSIDVTTVRVTRGGTASDLTSRIRYIAPDDGNGDDRTVMEVPLETPVEPAETIDVYITWTSKVPRPVARTGAIGNYFFIAQWFPKIGVFEDTGWNCHQFHATTEFFADFGNYDVQLSVPTGWTVGATGRQRQQTPGSIAFGATARGAIQALVAGGTTHHYYQEDVHDFAWTTSPDYIEHHERFEHPALPPVDMRLLLQPEHAGQARRHFDATRAALKYYGEWFGPYPYGHITIVDPAFQSGADGMEYPTLFTAGTRWIAPRHATDPEDVTIHEAGHQFWYGIIATNEFEHAWMDEGLNTFSTSRVMEQAFAPSFYVQRYFGDFIPWVFRGLEVTRTTQGRISVARATGDDQSKPSWRYWPKAAGAISYYKTASWLHTLERMLGWETLQRAMSTYFARYAFRHPKPTDFFAVLNEVSGQDLTWFFDEVYRGSSSFDYSIELLRSEPSEKSFRTTVVARRIGEGSFPVSVRVVFDNDEEQRWQWDGRDRWKLFETQRDVAAAYAQVDPDGVLLLDVDTTNNSFTLKPQARRAARKWSLAWLIWLQDHLLTYGFFV
jgi:hypothetical protein